MAQIAETSIKAGGRVDVPATTLSASDVFVYRAGGNQYLVIENSTGSAVTPSITGSLAPDDLFIPTYGTIDISGAHELGEIEAGGWQITPLESIRLRLDGIVSLVGCEGCKAMIIVSDSSPPAEILWIMGGKLIAGGMLTVNSRLY